MKNKNISIQLADMVCEVELSRQLDLSPKTIKNRISKGLFPLPVRLPGSCKNYFIRGELDKWLSQSLVRRPEIGCGSRKGRKPISVARAERNFGMELKQ